MNASTLATVTVESLPVLVHQGTRVVTTDLLAQLYGTQAHNITVNYRNNEPRFEAGKHFHKLTGDELRAFKNQVNDIDLVPVARNASHLLLWTERGAARHAKMLDTDQAWDVFERLEEAYFRAGIMRESTPQPINPTPAALGSDTLLPSEQQTLQEIVHAKVASVPADRKGKALAEAWSRLHRKFRVSKYDQLRRDQLSDAILYVTQMELRDAPAPLAEAEPSTGGTWLAPAAPAMPGLIALTRRGDGSYVTVVLPEGTLMFTAAELPGLIADPMSGTIPKALLPAIIQAAAKRLG